MSVIINGTTGIDTPALDSDALPTVNGGNFPLDGFRNKIIGGDFTTNPWQRGTSFADIITGYSADRWAVAAATTSARISAIKTVDAPTVAQAGVYTQHCLHGDCTTADAVVDAGDYYAFRQSIEGLNAASFGFGQAGTRYITLSFWHKHTKTGTYCVSFRNSATDRSYVAEYTQDTTDTWEKATISIAVDTSGTWLYDSGVGLRVDFVMMCGSTYQGAAGAWAAADRRATSNQVNALDSTSNNFKIALVQLEAGSVATPFETRSVGQEYQLAARYYYRTFPAAVSKHLDAFGANYSTINARFYTRFPVQMRAAPSALEQSGTANQYNISQAGTGNFVCSSVPTFSTGSVDGATTTFTVASGLTAYVPSHGWTDATNGANAYLGWSAEL